MYKELRKHIKEGKLPDSEKSFSQEQAMDMIKELILKKSAACEDIEEEALEKGIKNAFKTGLSVLGLIHGAHYMDDSPAAFSKAPQAQERNVASIKKAPTSEIIAPTPEGSYKDKNINNFLKAISMNETSGGKNLNHRKMKTGLHAGDAAVGQYGLMPNTVKETVNRMGRSHPLHRKYSNMPNEKIAQSMGANPEHEQAIASHMANRLHGKFGGDESKMSYSWLNGSNLTNNDFASKHKDYQNHDYVQKYHKHKQDIEKTPVPTNVASSEP